MPTITGTLADFGLDNLDAYEPIIVFTPSGPATTPDGFLLAARPITAIPNSEGYFALSLVSGESTIPATHYKVTIEWLDAPASFIGKDFPEWKLYVPAGGGAIGDIGWAPSNPALAYFGTEPPPGSTFTDGTWWLDADMDDPVDPDASGTLYEWSN